MLAIGPFQLPSPGWVDPAARMIVGRLGDGSRNVM